MYRERNTKNLSFIVQKVAFIYLFVLKNVSIQNYSLKKVYFVNIFDSYIYTM